MAVLNFLSQWNLIKIIDRGGMIKDDWEGGQGVSNSASISRLLGEHCIGSVSNVQG